MLALVFGVMFVLPIGGADMPVVISLLNAFTGLAASATGFVLDSTVLIVSGMLVGASGTLLTLMMAKAMNRSVANVLFGAFGQVQAGAGGPREDDGRTVRATTPEDVAVQLSFARKVIVVPGYGMAVAQAQHDVRQLAEVLEEKGVDVAYAIHPVAGRMPGHMNVLLAEANVPYDQLKEMDEINPEFAQTDVALVIGANDVDEPRGAERFGQPDLRHAHPRRRQGSERDRDEAEHEPRLRRDRQRALPRPSNDDAVRRREGLRRQAHRRRQGGVIDGVALTELLGEPADVVRAKLADRLTSATRRFVERSPFVLLATAAADGRCDVSPRGDPAGFVRILDARTLLLPDRPGNRLADSLRNILANPHAGLLFLIPGLGETLRVNGRASVVTEWTSSSRARSRGKCRRSGS